MQATITYLLTEQAQRVQMAATGQLVTRRQTVTVEISAQDLPLCKVAEDGSLSVDTADEHEPALVASGWRKANPVEATTYGPDILADIHRGQATLDAAYVEACHIASQYVRDSDESIAHPAGSYHVYVPYTVLPKAVVLSVHPRIDASKYDKYGIYSTDLAPDAMDLLRTRSAAKSRQYDIDVSAALDRLTNYDSSARIGVRNANVYDVSSSSSPIVAAAYARWKERKAESARIADAVAKACEEAKTTAIDAYVAGCGDALIQQQYADELLCRKTIIARMANAALDAAGLPAECPDSIVCQNSSCPCHDKEVDCIPPTVYARWKALGLPDDVSVEFHRVRNCQRDEDGYEPVSPAKYHAHVTIPSGPFQFTRRIKL